MAGRPAAAAMGLALWAAGPAGAASHALVYTGATGAGINAPAKAGLERAERRYGVDVATRTERQPQPIARALSNFAAQVDHVIALSAAARPGVAWAAQRHRDTRFSLVGATVAAPNVRSIRFRSDQAGYLVGIAAGRKTATGRVGYIAAMGTAMYRRYGCGFLQGVKTVRPEATVAWRYVGPGTGGLAMTRRARAIARNQVRRGADIVFAAGGPAGRAALDAAVAAGALGIGAQVNRNARAPGRILTSAVKRIDRAVAGTIGRVESGTWQGGVVRLGVAEGGIDWALDRHNRPLAEPVAARVAAAKRQLAQGERQLATPGEVDSCL